jgi:CubicO group peptidase (beta-lactamase class C family)
MLAGVSTELPRSTPADQQVDPQAVLAFVDAVDADPAVEQHSLMVIRHGQVVAEGWWAPHTPERPRLLYSLSKSFTSTAFAFALQEGLVALDDTLVSHFPEFQADITDARSRSVTLRHLASMASGHNREMMQEAVTGDPQEPVRGFLLVPPDEEPGSVFAYSQPCTYALGSVIQRAAGMPLTEYLRPRLFDPLGIGEVGWLTWPPGREQGFSGLFARTEDIAKLGQLYLQRGRWGDRQLIPAEYVLQATSRQVDTAGSQDNPDWRQGYGFQFWMSRHGYRGDGALGQFCIVLPEHDAVVAVTAGTENMQGLLDHLWRHLLPGFATGRPDGGAQRDLDERLAGLRLRPCVAKPGPPQWSDWTSRPYAVGHGTEGLPSVALTSVELHNGEHGLDVTIKEPNNALTFPVGATDWAVSAPGDAFGGAVPVAASGGWLDDHTVRVELIFLETPHRMDIACTLPTGTAEAVWRQQPLEDRIARQHRPR